MQETILFNYIIKEHPEKCYLLPYLDNPKTLSKIGRVVYNFYKEHNATPSLTQLKTLKEFKELEIPESTFSCIEEIKLENYEKIWLETEFIEWSVKATTNQMMTNLINELKLVEHEKNSSKKIKNLLTNFSNKILHNHREASLPLFDVKTATEWQKISEQTPNNKRLFSNLWFEKETCILFASTNMGKSVLAVQILDSISKGISINGFVNETSAQKVLYIDFELSTKQFAKRTTDPEFGNFYKFNDNFMRAELDPNGDFKKSGYSCYEDYFDNELTNLIVKTQCKILCIDNISFLLDEGEKSQKAIQLLKKIKTIRDKFDLSILVIAHTPKIPFNKIMEVTDLAGSAAIGNFIRSMFAIGRAVGDETLRYIKQLKTTDGEISNGTDNVAVCRMDKSNGLLKFNFIEFADEIQLKNLENRDKQLNDRDAKILELHKTKITAYAISKQTGFPKSTVERIIKKFENPESKKEVNESNYFTTDDNKFKLL